jgi:membrane protease YdiL (CAAX protease family)
MTLPGVRVLRAPLARVVLFLTLTAAAFPLGGVAVGTLGLSGAGAAAWFGGIVSVLLLAATIVCAFLDGERLADLGFRITRPDLLALPVAFAVGALLFSGMLLASGAAVGGTWQINAAAPWRTALAGLVPVLCLMLGEELLFRGYAFQQARRLVGPTGAIAASAALFGLYHLLGTGYWAMGAVFRFAMPAIGGLVFGYALVRTGSLAVPVGLHWGGNWAQSVLLGLGHTADHSRAVWIMPLSPEQIHTLTTPDLLPNLPYLAALALIALGVRLTPRGLAPADTPRHVAT